MAEGWAGWQKGCAIGCIGVVVLGVILVVGGVAYVKSMFNEFDQAIGKRQQLEQRFGTREDFVPWPDGAVPPERLEAFLEVRRALADHCERFEAAFGQFQRMEQYEDSEKGPPPREILAVMRSAFDMAPLLGQYFDARNQALLDNEMGFGEYTYICATAYYTGPVESEAEKVRLGSRDRLSRRTNKAYQGMLRALLQTPEDGQAVDGEWTSVLSAEIEALEADQKRRPWADGLPPQIAASLEPRAAELKELRCPEASEFELGRNRRRGMSIHSD